MSLVRCNDVSLHFGDQVIFDHAEFTLEAGERVCLVGRNGAGKSTLFRLLTGAIVPDSGAIVRRADVRVSELEQSLPDALERTVRDCVAGGIAEHEALIARYHALTAGTLAAADLHELEDLQRQIELHGGWDTSAQIGAVLSELDLPPDKRLAELSGGWQRRVALARALVARPDILLLDEPTNHLDLTAIEWLERHVQGFRGTVLFITHDRAFLRALATRILDLDRGRLRSWPGDYDKYLELKEQALAEEAQAHALFDKKLAEEERWIRQGIKARRTRNEGRVRALERMRGEYARRTRQEGRARIELEEAAQSSRRVIRARHLHHAFGSHVVLNDLSLDIMRGDRVGLLGNNGVGKSTLLRILLGEITPDGGTVTLGENLVMGYFDQRRRDLDPTRTVADIVGDGRDYVTIGGRQRHIIGYLQGFLFSARRAQTPVGYLSGGECNRVILARLFSQPSNLLVLDEPTNDLDVETLEVLEAELAEYQGTLLIVSHDRAFLDNVVTSTLVFEAPGVVTRYPGGYSDWLRQGRGLAAPGAEAVPATPTAPPAPPGDGGAPRGHGAPPRLSYKLRFELEQLPARIEAREAAIAALETAIAAPGFYARPYPEVQAQLEQLSAAREELDALMNRWDELETLSRQAR